MGFAALIRYSSSTLVAHLAAVGALFSSAILALLKKPAFLFMTALSFFQFSI
jgi:hypothetical protein